MLEDTGFADRGGSAGKTKHQNTQNLKSIKKTRQNKKNTCVHFAIFLKSEY